MTARTGFIGLGNIGKPMAIHLAKSEYPCTVFDINPKACEELAAAGATVAGNPAQLADAADYIGICVRDDADTFAVMQGENGILATAKPGTVVAIHSTVKIETIRKLAAMAAEKQVTVFDAPITGGAHGAASKQLYYMCGGDEQVVRNAEKFMLTSGQKVVFAGELGSGMKLKLCNNLMTYIELMALHEGMKLAKASGLNLDVLKEVTSGNGVLTPNMKMVFDTKRGFDEKTFAEIMTGFKAVAIKDLSSALDLADSLDIALPGTGTCREAMKQVFGHG
ncbi:MAG TPA: NAD(P)-dependent oxidoreductase [Pseudomonadales bacterium]|nr:NAD(P)-dependent oxidoreductase [Pseudomonadales bacterium]